MIGKSWIAAAVVLAATATSSFAGTVNALATDDTGAFVGPTVGGFTMVAFGDDVRAVIADVSDVAAPTGGVVGFSPDLSHREIGNGWATWSHGYTGDVYYSNGATSITLTMPANTAAFYLYAEPNSFSNFTVTGFGTDGITNDSDSMSITGSAGAKRFEFWMSGGGSLTSITISSTTDFAVGEFGIATVAVPLPSAALSGLALLGVLGFVSFRRRNKSVVA